MIEVTWAQILHQELRMASKKRGAPPAPPKKNVTTVGDVLVPEDVAKILNKEPKFSLEPDVKGQEWLSLNRQIARKAPEEKHEKCLLDCVATTRSGKDPLGKVVDYFQRNKLCLLLSDKEGGFVVMEQGDYNTRATEAIRKNFEALRPSDTKCLGLASFSVPDPAVRGPAESTLLLDYRDGLNGASGCSKTGAPSTCLLWQVRLRAPSAHKKSTRVIYRWRSSVRPCILVRVKAMTKRYNTRDRERHSSEMNGDGAVNLQALGVADSGAGGQGSGTSDTASEQQLALLQLQLKIAEAETEKHRLILESQRFRAREGAEPNDGVKAGLHRIREDERTRRIPDFEVASASPSAVGRPRPSWQRCMSKGKISCQRTLLKIWDGGQCPAEDLEL
ncbi:hypothetical protein HPB50_007436 [Hyalomma asiaticum]|uniref:Uncharacterized protein n=1 Tax=Hyalomma asiaticum TaxID=266040 RepID=A0ACB7RSG5_HYAAI|nr:hypothetical protein HPB50_007436 [Hyalomma asiaticum]